MNAIILAAVLSGIPYTIDPPIQWMFGLPPTPRGTYWGIPVPDSVPADTLAVDVQAWLSGGNPSGGVICTGRLFLYGPEHWQGGKVEPAHPALICYTHLAVQGEGERSTCTGTVPIYRYMEPDGTVRRMVVGWWDTLVNNVRVDARTVNCFNGWNVWIRGGLR